MEIKTLGLLNFGKFKDKNIKLKSGINIIFGENERGKSTIHTFIDGIFYGFSKNNLKRSLTDELFERYRPWNFSSYNGYIELISKERYRIDRDFVTQDIKVLNLDTGLNLSNLKEYNKYSKIEQPGVYFFNLNRDEFIKSIYISQLNSKLDKDGKNLLKEKINNFISTGTYDFNYNTIVENLEKYIDFLGKKTLSKSEIGKCSKKISEIDGALINLNSDRDYYGKYLNELKIAEDELKIEEKKYSGRINFEINILKKEINELEKIRENHLNNKIDIKEYERVFELNSEVAGLLSRVDELYLSDDIDLMLDEDIEMDFEKYESIKEEIRELDNINYSKEMEFLSLDIKKVKNQNLKFKFVIIIALLCIIFITILAIIFKKYYLLTFNLIFGFYIYLRIVKHRINSELLKRLYNKMLEYKEFSMKKTAKKKSFDNEFKKLFGKYNKDSREDLEVYFKDKIKENNKIRNEIDYINLKNKDNKEELKKLKKQIAEKEDELELLLKKYEASNVNEFRNKFEESNSSDLVVKINEKKLEYKKLLDQKTDDNEIYSESSLINISNKIKEIKLKISNIKGKIYSKEISITKIKELEEEKYEINKRLNGLFFEKEAAELALNTIKEILDENRNNFIPRIREFIKTNLEQITDGKYIDIIIDDNLNILVYDNDFSKYVDIDSLSIGTMDQIYFLFRLSITSLYGDEIPLILDDVFSNYDDIRLKNSLIFLKNFGQVILFTSTNREMDLLNELDVKYNLIRL